MTIWHIVIIASLIILNFTPIILAQDLTDDLTLEVIIDGIKHYDSKIQSLKSDVVYESTISGMRWQYEYTLAYMGLKDYLDIRMWQRSKTRNAKAMTAYPMRLLYIFDGERRWGRIKSPGGVQYTVTSSRNFMAELDPRFWIAHRRNGYERYGLAHYFIEQKAKVIGKEKLGDELCYVIKIIRNKEHRKFWIAPQQGFRLLQAETASFKSNSKKKWIRKFSYHQYSNDIWFPKAISHHKVIPHQLIHPNEKENIVNQGKLTFRNVEINTDISELFRVKIPKNARFSDFDSNRSGLAKNLLSKEYLE